MLPMPRWRETAPQPIDERDVIEFLARTPQVPDAAGRSLDVAGPDVMTYGRMIERIAEAMGVGRLPLGFGRSLTPPASAVVAAVTGQPVELVRPLMESLETDLLPRDPDEAPRLYGMRPHRFDRALDHALARVGARRAAGGAMKVERDIRIDAPPKRVYDVVMDPQRLEDWVTIHDHLEDAPDRLSSRRAPS